jgi:hypothetical protein
MGIGHVQEARILRDTKQLAQMYDKVSSASAPASTPGRRGI